MEWGKEGGREGGTDGAEWGITFMERAQSNKVTLVYDTLLAVDQRI